MSNKLIGISHGNWNERSIQLVNDNDAVFELDIGDTGTYWLKKLRDEINKELDLRLGDSLQVDDEGANR